MPLDPGRAPTPMLVIYHVKPGAERQLEAILKDRWHVYQQERLARSEPHVLVRAHEDELHEYYIEIYTLTGCFATEYPSVRVQTLEAEAAALCESRGGHLAVEYQFDIPMLAPKLPKVKD